MFALPNEWRVRVIRPTTDDAEWLMLFWSERGSAFGPYPSVESDFCALPGCVDHAGRLTPPGCIPPAGLSE